MAKRTTTKRSRGKSAKKASAVSRRRPAARAALPDIAPASKLSVKNLITANAMPTSVGGTGMANTVVYIHGIANKPPASVLKCQWDTALFGTRLGDRTRMAYWVNRERYPAPSDETCGSPDAMSTKGIASISGIPSSMAAGDGTTIEASIRGLTSDPARQAFLEAIALKMHGAVSRPADRQGVSAQDVHAKIFPLPEWARRAVADQLTKAFLADVHDFLFDAARRDAMEQALIDRLEPGGGPFVVVAHSQGTMIAYDVLRRMDAAKIKVPLFVTIGSPLGMQEVQDALRQWIGRPTGVPFPKCVDRWVNVAERFDPVAADPTLDDEYEGKIEDINGFGLNPNWFGDPHSATGYLSTEHVRRPVRETVGTAFPQAIAPFAIAKDLVAQIEDGHREQRHEVLIQLADTGSGKGVAKDQTQQVAEGVVGKIHDIVTSYGCKPDDAETETPQAFRFRATDAHRSRVAALLVQGSEDRGHLAQRSKARAHLAIDPHRSGAARQSRLRRRRQEHRVGRARHRHSRRPSAFQGAQATSSSNGTARRPAPLTQPVSAAKSATLDGNGHGTHVAGTIAGGMFQIPDANGIPVDMTGMAPRCSLYGFKVLADSGNGQDSWIIKALDKITEINDAAGQLVIHGVNLSLGGGFDPSAFGCGHTPLCQELRRLCRQGVLVCLAAGNEGYALLAGDGGEIQANLDLSIGDPANLEEAIAVGSVHKTNPHTYGISYFSSRGPTADGRRKPDVVAPGEKIVSAAPRLEDEGQGRPGDGRHALRGDERHQHGDAARLRRAGGVPVAAARVHRLSGAGEADAARRLRRPEPRPLCPGRGSSEPDQDAGAELRAQAARAAACRGA